MGALGLSWWVLGELWGPIWASLAALETIENHWFLLYFQLWGHISSQRHLRGQASDALIPCPSKYLVRFGPKSLVCPSHLSNLGQVTCLSKSLVQFGPSHMSVQVTCPILAKSPVGPSRLSNLGQVICLSKSLVPFGPSHLRPSHLSNSGQVTCLSKSLVQFGPRHLSLQIPCPIWAKSLVCRSHLSNLGQATCRSKSLIQFGPSHLSVHVTYPSWAKSLVCPSHLSRLGQVTCVSKSLAVLFPKPFVHLTRPKHLCVHNTYWQTNCLQISICRSNLVYIYIYIHISILGPHAP